MSALRFLPVGLLWAAALAGCASNPILNTQTTVLVPTAGGKTASMTFGSNGPLAEENADFKVGMTLPLMPDATNKHVLYAEKLYFKGAARPMQIKVEDISEDPIVLVTEDDSPKVDDKGVWQYKSDALDPKDPRIAWISSLDDTIRVLRFSVVLKDGRISTLDQAVSYPGVLKTMVRKMLGMDY